MANIAEGMWLSAELLVWGSPSMQSTMTYQVCVFKISMDLYMPSDSTQPMMPDKEQLQLQALHAAKASWLKAL